MTKMMDEIESYLHDVAHASNTVVTGRMAAIQNAG
jgi:hypothetical protein